MLATVPRKAIACLGSMLVVLAVTACGGGTAEPAPAGPSPYVEAISPIVSSIGPSLELVEAQLAAVETAMLESAYVVPGTGGQGTGPEDLMRFFTDGAAVLAQEATKLEALEEQIAQISPPKEAREYHELLAEYVGMKKEGARAVGRWFERQDVLCCITIALSDWERQSEKADVTKDEFNAEARRLGYPEAD